MNITQEGRDFFKSQGMESKIDKMVKMNSLFIGKGGFRRAMMRCLLKNRSNKNWAPEYYTNRVSIDVISDR